MIKDVLVEDFNRFLHALLDVLFLAAQGFFTVNIACLDEELLQLKQVKLKVFVLLDEHMLVICLHQLEVLLSQVLNCGHLVLLKILHFFSTFEELCDRFLKLLHVYILASLEILPSPSILEFE